jgi:hypothetical protein
MAPSEAAVVLEEDPAKLRIAGLTEREWSYLIRDVVDHRVIPVIGEAAVTFEEGAGRPDAPLYLRLPRELAPELGLGAISTDLTLGDVARRYLGQLGADRSTLYGELLRLADAKDRRPGKILRQIASIDDFALYLSATCDPLLQRALETVRSTPQTIAYCPSASAKDLSDPMRAPTVYHLLGRASPRRGEYVVWEDDLLDFVLGLARDFQTDATLRMREYLSRRSLLAIGLGLSDWILLLLFRLARQRPFIEDIDHRAWLIEPSVMGRRPTVFVIGGVRKGIRAIDSSVEEFVEELYRRWQLTRPPAAAAKMAAPTLLGGGEAPFVFISYAREDEASARKIKEALEQECAIFFDKESLQTGQNYEREIAAKIRAARVFVSIVSRNTERSSDGDYFRVERRLASERESWLAEVDWPKYYLPVIVDPEPPQELVYEPANVLKHQWTHCPGGSLEAAPKFVETVAQTCKRRRE